MDVVSGAVRQWRRRRSYYLVKKVASVTGQDLRGANPTIDENNRPAVRFTLTSEGAREVRQGHRREHRPHARDHSRQSRVLRPAHRGADHRRRAYLRQLHDAGSQRSLARASLRRAARVDELPRGAGGRSHARRRLRPRRVCWPHSRGSRWSVIFMLVYYKLSGINAIIAMWRTWSSCIGFMAYSARR